jgi:membrane associated rhomboid family serine protease
MLGREGASPPFLSCGALLAAIRSAAYVTPMDQQLSDVRVRREPMFNVPTVVVATLAALVLVHVLRIWVLTEQQDVKLLLWFAFIPARYDAAVAADGGAVTGLGPQIWTFFTYALVHGDWTHLGLNGVWLLAFGTPIARRFGALRFLAFFAVTAAAGAAAHLATHVGAFIPVIGASASISGFMAGAMRFAFQRSGPLGFIGRDDPRAYRVPALPLIAVLRDPRVLVFLAVWFGLNLLFGAGSISLDGNEQQIAWQAHIGGFLAGLIGFALFDPVKRIVYGGSDDQTAIH